MWMEADHHANLRIRWINEWLTHKKLPLRRSTAAEKSKFMCGRSDTTQISRPSVQAWGHNDGILLIKNFATVTVIEVVAGSCLQSDLEDFSLWMVVWQLRRSLEFVTQSARKQLANPFETQCTPSVPIWWGSEKGFNGSPKTGCKQRKGVQLRIQAILLVLSCVYL